jgi:hypothetical protein
MSMAGDWIVSLEHWLNDSDRGKLKYLLKYLEKNLSQHHFVHHESHMDWCGIELGPPLW